MKRVNYKYYNMVVSLLMEERIKTTLSRAKALRPLVEPFITEAKKDTDANRRRVCERLQNNKSVTAKLFETLGPRFEKRPGGYLRIIKCGFRKGDGAPMAHVLLIND